MYMYLCIFIIDTVKLACHLSESSPHELVLSLDSTVRFKINARNRMRVERMG